MFEGRGLWLDMVVWTIKVLQYWWQWPSHPKKNLHSTQRHLLIMKLGP